MEESKQATTSPQTTPAGTFNVKIENNGKLEANHQFNFGETEDFLVSNIMLPLGSLIFVIFCTTHYGWGFQNFLKEANEGKGMKFPRWMRPYVTYVLPVIVVIIFVAGMISFFGA